jgi:hypothetical protein
MPRNRVIYQSEVLYVSQFASSTEEEEHLQLSRVQSFNYDFSVEKTDVFQFGQLAKIDSIQVNNPVVTAEVSYYVTDGYNEKAIQFYVQETTGSGLGFLRYLPSDQEGINMYLLTGPEGEDAADKTGSFTYVAFGNMFPTNYNVSAAVGQLPTVNVSFEGLNALGNTSASMSGFTNPAYDTGYALPYNTVTLPSPSKLTGSGIPSAIRPGDITVTISTPTGLRSGFALDVSPTNAYTNPTFPTTYGTLPNFTTAGDSLSWTGTVTGTITNSAYAAASQTLGFDLISGTSKVRMSFDVLNYSSDAFYHIGYQYINNSRVDGSEEGPQSITGTGSYSFDFTHNETVVNINSVIGAVFGTSGSEPYASNLSVENIKLELIEHPFQEVGAISSLNDYNGLVSDPLHVQSVSLDLPLSRTTIEEIGRQASYAKPIDTPITVQGEVSVITSTTEQLNVAEILNQSENFDINVNFADAGLSHLSFDVKKANLVSESFSSAIGSNKTCALVFEAQLGAFGNTTHGLFASGSASSGDYPYDGFLIENNLVYDASGNLILVQA